MRCHSVGPGLAPGSESLMKRASLYNLNTKLPAGCSWRALGAPRVKVLKLSVTNPSDETRLAEDIVVNVAGTEAHRAGLQSRRRNSYDQRRQPRSAEDASTLQTIELPSQSDDLDGDNKFDELAFQIDLKPWQTRIVTIAYGDTATIQRLRSDYPKRTAAKFTMKFDGLGWESEATAWRIYFDQAQRDRCLGQAPSWFVSGNVWRARIRL